MTEILDSAATQSTANDNLTIGHAAIIETRNNKIRPWLSVPNNLIGYFEDDKIKIMDITTKKLINTLNYPAEKSFINIWYFDKFIATYSYSDDDNEANIEVWDITLTDCQQILKGHTDIILSVICHNDLIISCSGDNTIRIWDSNTGDCHKILKGHTAEVDNIVATGNLLISSSEDDTIRFWDIESGKCLKRLVCDDTYVWSLCLKNNMLICGLENGYIQIWDIYTYKQLYLINGKHLDNTDSDIGISHIGIFENIIITTDQYMNDICFWDIATSKCIKIYKKQPHGFSTLTVYNNLFIQYSKNINDRRIVINPITLLPGEQRKFNAVISKYDIPSHLTAEIMDCFN